MALAGVSGCRREPHVASGAIAATGTDSISGIVRVVGVEAFPQVTLATDDGAPALTLDGPPSLRKVAGLRITVFGARRGSHLGVTRFVVIAANSVAATDGILVSGTGGLVLVTADGARHKLVAPPAIFLTSVGHRVWLSGPLDREPVAFGIIE